jgi:hypothetical protein
MTSRRTGLSGSSALDWQAKGRAHRQVSAAKPIKLGSVNRARHPAGSLLERCRVEELLEAPAVVKLKVDRSGVAS